MIHKIYSLMVPPFELKDFEDMNKKEVKQFFDWYIKEIPSRIAQLKDAFELGSGKSGEVLDFTPESLKFLWAWFIPLVELVLKTEEEIEQEVARAPDLLKDTIRQNKYKLSTGTWWCPTVTHYYPIVSLAGKLIHSAIVQMCIANPADIAGV